MVNAADLSSAQRIIIEAARYTQEANAPSWALAEKFTLPRGSKTVSVPKLGQFTLADLTDGTDISTDVTGSSNGLGYAMVDLTAAEVGGMVTLTDKLVRQNGTTDVFRMVGRQFGDAGARKRDTDVQLLYPGLNGGTAYGSSVSRLTLEHFAATIANARGGGSSGTGGSAGNAAEAFDPTYAVVHPHMSFDITKSATAIGNNNVRVNDQREEAMLNRFWRYAFGGVEVYDSNNIGLSSINLATGVIAQRDAIATIESIGWTVERERNASLRATEVVFVSDYGVAELDDAHGAPLTYLATPPATSS